MIIYPPTQNGLQKTLDAQLDQGTTASLTLNNTTGVQNKPGVVVLNRIDANGVVQAASDREWVTYTGVSGSTLTGLTRGIGGSSDQDHAVGTIVEFIFDITAAQSIAEALATLVDGTTHTTVNATNVVTPADTQTLTNKTLTSPKIGTAINDTNGNELIKVVATGSAVNEITLTNAATGGAPIIESTGGDSNIHLVARAKGNAFTKFSIMRQNNATVTYKHNTVITSGWGWIQGDGSASRKNEGVSFGDMTYAAAPVVMLTFAGFRDGSDPSTCADFNATTDAQIEWRHYNVGTTGFTAEFKADGAVANTIRVGYTWIAIGEL